MKARCQALLGTFVEISIEQDDSLISLDDAFKAIKQIQDLMSFHDPLSELNQINQYAHLKTIQVHPWTAEVLKIAQDIHRQSDGLFNCGIGHRLVAAGLLPRQLNLSSYQLGGIEDICFITPQTIHSKKPICLDLGGIAKGFAVDKAIDVLRASGIDSACVNAGGDLRVFGDTLRSIQIRNPSKPTQLLDIGILQNGAIATSSLYFAQRDHLPSHIINPLTEDVEQIHVNFSGSFSVIAKECVYADALTKVLALSNRHDHPCLHHFCAQAIKIAI